MACNVCGCTIINCEKCKEHLNPEGFLCFEGDLGESYHFCDKNCFQEWLDEQYCNRLEDAEDDGT